jgi:hypothetical protein
LVGSHNICELGRAEPFGIGLVLPQVKNISVYDDVVSIRNEGVTTPPVDVHDIVQGPLPKLYDAIYSFNVLERISPEHETDFVQHLRDSLSGNCDVAIVGCPSPYCDGANLADRAGGHIYTRTGPELIELMLQEFDMVILFSMIEEVIQVGFSPKAQYFLALCSNKKQP